MNLIIRITLILGLLASSEAFASGWYLLIPPNGNYNAKEEYLHGIAVLSNKPLPFWTQDSAYNTANDCETARNNYIDTTFKIYKADQKHFSELSNEGDQKKLEEPRRFVEIDYATYKSAEAGICIAGDDPRLQH